MSGRYHSGSQARSADKRAAQQRVMQMILPEDLNSDELALVNRCRRIQDLIGLIRSFSAASGAFWSGGELWCKG